MGQDPVRFGVYEVDLASGELRKQGLRIRLQEQPFAVLAALLEHPGEVVSRDDLVRRLWPDGTVVDFDRGLNAAVTRLRQALSDSAETPRYVETVARRGYRFIGTLAAAEPLAPSPPPTAAPRRPRWYLAAVSLSVTAFIAVGLWLARNPSNPSDREWTVVPLTTDRGSEIHASFSPDGSQITYQWNRDDGKPHVYVKLVGPGDPIRLTSSDAPEFGPAWSPDGRLIAFLRQLDPDHGALIVSPALGGVERTVTDWVFPFHWDFGNTLRWLDWTPDSRRLVVSGPERPGAPERLGLISVETGEKRWLTGGPPVGVPSDGDREPAVSPDGRTIAFSRGELFASERIYLLPMTSDWRPAGDPRPLDTGGFARSPAWTPDGRELLFKPYGQPSGGLSIIGVRAGDRPRPLPELGTQLALPSFSRTGRLTFSRGGSDRNVWRQEIASAGPVPPAAPLLASTAIDAEARYSPDGTRITFSSDRTGNCEIWVCAADGSHSGQITSFDGPFIVGSPRWSPDGTRIAFDSAAAGRFNVYTVDANGGPPKRLIDASMFGAIPSWSHDGKWVYFFSTRSGRNEIWKVASSGGEPLQVTKNGGHTAFESTEGTNLYYTKREDDATLFRSALDGSGEQEVVRHVAHRGFTFGAGVIYYLRAENRDLTTIRRFTLATGADAELGRVPGAMYLGLSVTPDEKYLIYSRTERRGDDLMLVDRFR